MVMLKKAFLLAALSVVISLAITRFSTAPPLSSQYAQDNPKYTVGTYQGMVAVFRRGEQKPTHILYSYVNTLPDDMAEQLQSGIPAHNEKELVRVLEQYSS